jgi:mono/diheme cytochrome c family protein
MPPPLRQFPTLLIGLGACCASALSAGAAERATDFNRDIRSILSNNCFKCHGPDTAERQAGLRLDTPTGATAETDSGAYAVVPGKPEASELISRITSDDADLRMPPATSAKQLKPAEIELLRAWIKQGATYAKHWSYEKPVRPDLPAIANKSWPKNEVDYFLLARLENEGLAPSPKADRYALIRRLSLDLTGLPPTWEEVQRFASDSDPRAYEKLVDRLLEKDAYGEHFARLWLDLARYADSAGYADDPPRTIWAYRDWVIRALNENKPFDQFTIEQIAGDLLENPTEDQHIATAFHRNTLTNNEGGTNDEEFRSVAIVDRVNTTLAVWMGTTIACAQCHNHKYDPITQEEFFRVYAIYNSSQDADRRDESPLFEKWTDEQEQQKADWRNDIAELEQQLKTPTPELLDAQQKWEEESATADKAEKPEKNDKAQKPELPANVKAILAIEAERRTEKQQQELTQYYLTIAPELKSERDQLDKVKKQLAALKPEISVPVMRDLAEGRKTLIQHRGNFLDTGKEVAAGVPAAFHALPEGAQVDRLALARWLVSDENPLTARVIANRYWEKTFGIGLVRTSEEFGTQGELPTNPELLDWLAMELVRLDWDMKAFLKLLVTSAAYRQSSRVTPELLALDPDNTLLARGPRFRLPAETIRDQALAVSGLLSEKMYGPPVKPPQPQIGLSAAFGSGIDWQTSTGEDRYRRGLYTTWRRSNPYPSMAAFDAPNREVCTIRRDRTNTPLQALVTLNDPVYVEAAQALARRIASSHDSKSIEAKARHGFNICLSRPPSDKELAYLTALYKQAHDRFANDAASAEKMATVPLGPAPKDANLVDLASWTVVSNVLLNLDEMFMRR